MRVQVLVPDPSKEKPQNPLCQKMAGRNARASMSVALSWPLTSTCCAQPASLSSLSSNQPPSCLCSLSFGDSLSLEKLIYIIF
jgi:hypothetical protein